MSDEDKEKIRVEFEQIIKADSDESSKDGSINKHKQK